MILHALKSPLMMLIIDMKKYHSLKPKTHGINIAAAAQTCIVTITKLQLLVTSYSYQ